MEFNIIVPPDQSWWYKSLQRDPGYIAVEYDDSSRTGLCFNRLDGLERNGVSAQCFWMVKADTLTIRLLKADVYTLTA